MTPGRTVLLSHTINTKAEGDPRGMEHSHLSHFEGGPLFHWGVPLEGPTMSPPCPFLFDGPVVSYLMALWCLI